MDSILKKLYRNTLDLEAADYPHLPGYQEATKRWQTLYDRLVAEMGEEFAEAFGDVQCELDDWYSGFWFEKGTRLGAQLMQEMMRPL